MSWIPAKRMALVAVLVFLFDQATKLAVLHLLGYAEQKVVVSGFFKFVYWGNTGAAWSLFYGYNRVLAVVSLVALVVLFLNHRHFDSHTVLGQIALGLMFGGIMGNLYDRVRVGHVIDFIYFYVQRRGSGEIGFPAFNVADVAICSGVGLIFLLSWYNERHPKEEARTLPKAS
ncbi:MAG: signal peptidase II [Candidatus Omnitrophica bacterium]|nr:signal peptidase II [Candidatus Omnitrophota bacterium]